MTDITPSRLVVPDFSIPRVTLPTSVTNPAQWAHERIVRSIIKFEANLDADHEIGARLVSFTDKEIIHIEDVGYWGPDFVIFYGRNVDGQPVELIQHVSQTNVLLVAAKKEGEKARRIGFDLAKKLEPKNDE